MLVYMRVILKSRTVDFYIILIDLDIFWAELEKYLRYDMIYPRFNSKAIYIARAYINISNIIHFLSKFAEISISIDFFIFY